MHSIQRFNHGFLSDRKRSFQATSSLRILNFFQKIVRTAKWGLLSFALLSTDTGIISAQTSMDSSRANSGNDTVAVRFDAVQPILRQHCVSCHNEDQPRAELILTSLDKVLAGSSSGPVVVPGQPQSSPLYLLTAHLESPRMPPNKPRLTPRELQKLSQWIETGLLVEAASHAEVSEETNAVPLDSASPPTSPLYLAESRACVPSHRVRHLSVNPTSSTLAIEGHNQVLLWNLANDSPDAMAIEAGEEEVSALQFNDDGSRLWIATGIPADRGALHCWNAPQAHVERSLGTESDTIQSLAISPDGLWVAIGTSSKQLKLLEHQGAPESVFQKHTDWVTATSITHDGFLVASGDRFGAIIVWDPIGKQEFATLRGHTKGVTSIVCSSDNDWLGSASLDGTIRWWNMHTAETSHVWQAHPNGTTALLITPEGSLISGGKDGYVRCWSKPSTSNESPSLVWEHRLEDEVLSMSLGNSGRCLAISDARGSITVGEWEQEQSPSLLPSMRVLRIPSISRQRQLVASAPIAPNRMARIAQRESNTASAALVDLQTVQPMDSREASPKVDGRMEQNDAASETAMASDIDALKLALEATKASLERSYETTKQLEENVARLQQVILLRETRARQAELDRRQKAVLQKQP